LVSDIKEILRMFKNKVWRKLHKAELHNLYSSLFYSGQTEEEMGGASNTHGKDGKYKILVRKPEGKRPLGGLRHMGG
jgi:hypothetical protein